MSQQKILRIAVNVFMFILISAQSRNFITEQCKLIFCDTRYLDMESGIFVNDKNEVAFKGSFMMKIDLPVETKVIFKAYRIINKKQYPFLVVEKRLQDVIEMERFDLQGLFVRNSVPPVVWPVKKWVMYRITGWVPDRSKFPATMPNGRWLVQMVENLPNETTIFILQWEFRAT